MQKYKKRKTFHIGDKDPDCNMRVFNTETLLYDKIEGVPLTQERIEELATQNYYAKCNFCNVLFEPEHSNEKYCSLECIKNANNQRRKSRTQDKRKDTCLICGNPIEQTNAKPVLYCSPACKQKAYRQRKFTA